MEQKIETGGPAFPPDLGEHDFGQRGAYWGMILRDYFMAHAPADPQPWFMPVMPPEPPNKGFLDRENRKAVMWRTFEQAAYYWGGKNVTSENPEHDVWRKERDKQRYVQWPPAWADEMLKSREVAAPAKPVDQVNAKLLQALKNALGFLEAVCFNTPNPKKRKDYADAASRCRAAIAKATGEQA